MKRRIVGIRMAALVAAQGLIAAAAELQESKIPKGAGGIGFLSLLVMEAHKSIEKHAAKLGHPGPKDRTRDVARIMRIAVAATSP